MFMLALALASELELELELEFAPNRRGGSGSLTVFKPTRDLRFRMRLCLLRWRRGVVMVEEAAAVLAVVVTVEAESPADTG